MTTLEVLEELRERGDSSAYILARETLPGVERRFMRLTNALAKLLEQVREKYPDAMYYTGSGGLHLLLGESHTGTSPNDQVSAFSARGLSIGDGDW